MVIMISSGSHRDPGTPVLFPKAVKLKLGAFTEDVAKPVWKLIWKVLVEAASSDGNMKQREPAEPQVNLSSGLALNIIINML